MGKAKIITCIDCNQEKPNKAHGRCASCANKFRLLNPEIKAKHRQASLEWKEKNLEKWKSLHATYEQRRRNKLGNLYKEQEKQRNSTDKRKQWKKEYYAKNKEYFAQKQREYRKRNPDKANERWEKWYEENPEKIRLKGLINDQKRIARERGLVADLTREQWQEIKSFYDNRCVYCGNKFERLTQDHIIPVTKGGGYTFSNIVPACRSCNSRKGNRELESLIKITHIN